jgi:hypothetical protein
VPIKRQVFLSLSYLSCDALAEFKFPPIPCAGTLSDGFVCRDIPSSELIDKIDKNTPLNVQNIENLPPYVKLN